MYKGTSWTGLTAFYAMSFGSSDIGTSKSASFTLSEETVVSFGNYFYKSGGVLPTYTNLKGRFQLESGSTATSYEPYVGGIPAPNPDYPQDMQVVTGEQNVNVHGKNLAYTGWAQDFVARIGATVDAKLETVDGRSCVWWKANAGYGSYDTKYIFKTDFKENTQYTVSFDIKPSAMFSNICFEYTDGTTVSFGGGLTPGEWRHISRTSTAGKTLKNLHAYYQNGGVYADINTFIIEEGATESPYEPYQGATYTVDLGSIELCKIGDYQDYIYKSGDDWYVHKETWNYTFDGSSDEQWVRSGQSTSTNFVAAMANLQSFAMIGGNADSGYCNYFDFATSLGDNKVILSGYQNGGYRFLLYRFTSGSTVTDLTSFITWLGNNHLKMVLVLSTATDTKVTDATLIGQLNTVHEWLTRYGYNATVVGNLPIIIDKTNL
jgi:hypothetical protein